MDEFMSWGKVNYLEVFEERMKPIVQNHEDEFLLGEYQILQRIYGVDDICGSLLMEFIDILDRIVKDECTNRWVEKEFQKEHDRPKLVLLN